MQASAARAKEKAEMAEACACSVKLWPFLVLRKLVRTELTMGLVWWAFIQQKKRLAAEDLKRDMMERKLAEAAAKKLRDAEDDARKEAVRRSSSASTRVKLGIF